MKRYHILVQLVTVSQTVVIESLNLDGRGWWDGGWIMKFGCMVSMLLHNQPALCSMYFPPFFETLPITIMILNIIVNQIFLEVGWSWQAVSLRKCTKWSGGSVSFMGDPLEDSEVTIVEPFLWATLVNDVHETTGGGSTSAVTWEMRAGGERLLTIKMS